MYMGSITLGQTVNVLEMMINQNLGQYIAAMEKALVLALTRYK